MSEASHSQASASGVAARRALLVGINAYPRHPLRGCLNDVAAVRDFLVEERGFVCDDIAILTDAQATRAAILGELHRQAAGAQSGDSLVFYFCGHGAQLPSRDPREADGLDEVLCPVDFAWTAETAIVDDELERLFDSVPDGVELLWVFDACHTGEIDEQLDVRVAGCRGLTPPAVVAPSTAGAGAAASNRHSVRRAHAHGVILSACAATEKAADVMVDGRAHGAFTHYLLAEARRTPGATTAELLAAARTKLAEIGQHPEGYGPGLTAPFLAPGGARRPRADGIVRPIRPGIAVGSSVHRAVSSAELRARAGAPLGIVRGGATPDASLHRDRSAGPGAAGSADHILRESHVKPREQRTVLIPAKPSVDADRHLHMYLAEASRLAKSDDIFGTRMSQLGLDLSGISASDAAALARAVKPAPRSGGVVCRTFWWGFHLEIPHLEIEALAAAGISHEALGARIEMAPHRVVPHLATLVSFVVGTFENIKRIDRGAGVFVSMSSFAPDLYVTTAVPVRPPTVRRPTDSDKIRAIGM